MPVRLDTPRAASPPTAGMSRRTRNGIIILGLLVVFLLIAILAVLLRPAPAAQPIGAPLPSGSAPVPTLSASSSPSSIVELPQSNAPVGAAAARGTVGPLFTGYDQTADGAVSAAMNFVVAKGSARVFEDEVRLRVDSYMYVDAATRKKWAVSNDVAAKARTKYGLTDQGIPKDPTQTVYSGSYPEYGGFQLSEYKGNTLAEVSVWYPEVFGVGDSLADLKTTWRVAKYRLVWSNGDWRIQSHQPTSTAPTPKDPSQLAVSFDERATLLGPGWQRASNASEGPINRLELPQE